MRLEAGRGARGRRARAEPLGGGEQPPRTLPLLLGSGQHLRPQPLIGRRRVAGPPNEVVESQVPVQAAVVGYVENPSSLVAAA